MTQREELKITAPKPPPVDAALRVAAETQQGNTDHFVVLYDDSLANGAALAQSVLDGGEGWYQWLTNVFGGVTPPPGVIFPDSGVPFHVHIRPGSNGAVHSGCGNTALFVDAFNGNDSGLVDYLTVSEVAEVFMAAQNKNWDCGSSQGEALSRLLAYEATGSDGDAYGFESASSWLNSPRTDYVSYNNPTDGDYPSIGCGTLFLNYMRHQLGIATSDIVQTAGNTLATTCHAITGDQYPFPPFLLLLHVHFPRLGGNPQIAHDNPFPLDLRTVELSGLAHLQDIGDVGWMNDKFVGTQHQSRRLEGFALKIDPPVPGLGLEYMAHIQDFGDTNWTGEGTYIGTRDQGKRLEGFAIQLVGPGAPNYTVMYTAEVENNNIVPFVQDGGFCGTRGQGLRVEGMLVHVLTRPRSLVHLL